MSADAWTLCTDRFMADANHRGKRNPFVDGACDECRCEAEGTATSERCADCGHRVGQHSPSGCTADRPAPLGGCDCIRTPSDVTLVAG